MAIGRLQSAIIENLVSLGRLPAEDQAKIVSSQSEMTGDALEQLLAEEYKIQPHHLLVAKARAFGMSPFNIARVKIHKGTFELIDVEFCQQNTVLPVSVVGDFVMVAFANPFELTISNQIQKLTGKRVVPLLAVEKEIRDRLNSGSLKHAEQFDDVVSAVGEEYSEGDGELRSGDLESEESAPIIQLANRIIEDAFIAGASDIHIEPGERELAVRYRIDGICQSKLKLPAKVAPALVARLKIMANLDIAERRLPQDGRIVFKQFTKKSIDIDLRCATAPLNFGEGMVMRILDKQKSTLPLPALGFSERNLARYREVIRQPYGMILH
ncbi:MAG: GspE/PulE family protein, partial [Opitutaceae bacterium]